MPAGAGSPGHPPPRRREKYGRSMHVLNFTYEDNIKIKYKQAAGISRTYYLSKETISRPLQSRETIPLSQPIVEEFYISIIFYIKVWFYGNLIQRLP
jgi:hypothetical protein